MAPKQKRSTMPSLACRAVFPIKPFCVFVGAGLKPGCKCRRGKKLPGLPRGWDGKKLPDLTNARSVKEQYGHLSNVEFFRVLLEKCDTYTIAVLYRHVDVFYVVREGV